VSASVLREVYPDVVLDQAVIDNNLPHVLVGDRGHSASSSSGQHSADSSPRSRSSQEGRQGEILRFASPFSFLALKCAVTSVHSGKRFSRMVLGKMDTDDHID